MKKGKIIGWVIGMLLVGMPTMAQQQEWKSTSTLQGSGSAYSSQVTAVGAATASDMGTTTTDSYSPAKAPTGPRKDFYHGPETGQDSESPVGDAVLPLLFLSLAFCGVIYLRRRKALSR